MASQYWHCDFCDYVDESRSNVEKHEKVCIDNPENQEEIEESKTDYLGGP
jgi:hypothetical protein